MIGIGGGGPLSRFDTLGTTGPGPDSGSDS